MYSITPNPIRREDVQKTSSFTKSVIKSRHLILGAVRTLIARNTKD